MIYLLGEFDMSKVTRTLFACSFAGNAPIISADRSEPWVIDSIEVWVAILIIWHFGAYLSDAHSLHLVGTQEAKLD